MKAMLAALVALALSGCEINVERGGPVEHSTQTVELDKSDVVHVDIHMGAGELRLEGGSAKLMDADFAYNIPSWKPEVRYDSGGFRGELSISQPHAAHIRSNVNYKWNIRLTDRLPLDVETHLGAGEARLDLGSVELRSLDVHMGVGELRMDLRGNPQRDYSVQVHGGVGHATIYLPNDVGVAAEATGGIGHIEMRGLEKRNGEWVTPGHPHKPVTIRLTVTGGIGDISVIAE
jgi:hypothetical protein